MAIRRVIQPSSDRPLTKAGGSPTEQVNSWIKIITDRALIIGSGSPAGVVEASQGSSYMDEAGLVGSVYYLKQKADIAGDKLLGWVLIG